MLVIASQALAQDWENVMVERAFFTTETIPGPRGTPVHAQKLYASSVEADIADRNTYLRQRKAQEFTKRRRANEYPGYIYYGNGSRRSSSSNNNYYVFSWDNTITTTNTNSDTYTYSYGWPVYY